MKNLDVTLQIKQTPDIGFDETWEITHNGELVAKVRSTNGMLTADVFATDVVKHAVLMAVVEAAPFLNEGEE